MTALPARPKIYHITHVHNLRAIAQEGWLVSDRRMIERGGPIQPIGMSAIKPRRVERIEVSCHPGTCVGDYVPFYFCPRSVMLYVIHRANSPDLTYRAGQEPIVHLEADLYGVMRHVDARGDRWAFSLSNAGAYYTEFRSKLEDLHQLDWSAIQATDFRDSEARYGKQAEFLVYDQFPFDLVERIGVQSERIRTQVADAVERLHSRPRIQVRPDWYF